jgi:PPK2 family polyphosphate:nucleotide phosphotransferase
MHDRLHVAPGTPSRMHDRDPADRLGMSKADAQERQAALEAELATLQYRLWAEHRRALLLVLQGLDASGKDSTIRRVFTGLNPQGCSVVSFKAPAGAELQHDYLWRIHARAPEHGLIGIFNRSHYEDVLAVRVHHLVPDRVWKARFELIDWFERQLVHGGTTLVKLFLHISREEQRRRLEERLTRPDKRWKFRQSDVEERSHWDQYRVAYEDALTRTSAAHAPWYVVPADHKWYRNWVVSRILVETLRDLDPRYPDPPDLHDVHIE